MSNQGPRDRRDFLSASGLLSGALLLGGPGALLAPARAGGLALRVLSEAESAGLMSIARTIAPHDTLADGAYALVIVAIDGALQADESLRRTVRSGLAQLGAEFAARPEAQRVAALRALEGSPFFAFLRAKTLATLYASPPAYAHFGYEGEAFSKGGYLLRGFDALDWLPDVPLEDSGPNPAHGG